MKRGRRFEYREIEIPTEAEMDRIAAQLHADGSATMINVLGWKVLYMPSFQISYSSTEVNPFSREQGETTRHKANTVSYCVFGYSSEWQVRYVWPPDSQSLPRRTQDVGDVVPLPSGSQESLFDESDNSAVLINNPETLFEGAIQRSELGLYERSREARTLCIAYYGTSCYVCEIDFGSIYGEIARGFIHVHHLNPLSTIGIEHAVDPVQDLRPVCPNCHAVIHMQSPPFSIEEVRKFLNISRSV